MSQSLAESVVKQVDHAIVEALKLMLGLSWTRSRLLANPHLVTLR